MANFEVRCVADCQAELGEGPIWDPRRGELVWVDILSARLFRHRPGRNTFEQLELSVALTSLGLRRDGGYIATTEREICIVDDDGAVRRAFGEVEPEAPANRFNDGKVDPLGGFWSGTMNRNLEGVSGALYCFDQNAPAAARKVDAGYGVTNGPAFFPDGRVCYHNDTLARVIYAFDFTDGRIGNKRVFARLMQDEGMPDGMTVDTEGRLYVAHFSGAKVSRFLPNGDRDLSIAIPATGVTSVAFGGDDLSSLYVTTARVATADSALACEPQAGGLFCIELEAKGLPPTVFTAA